MEDLFYFTKSLVTFEDIAEIAHEFGYETERHVVSDHDVLNVIYAGDEFWQWIPMRESAGDFNSFTPSEQQMIKRYEPSSSFIIAHHLVSWPVIRTFLKRVLERHEGWIGCDVENFEPTFTAENIG